MGRLCAFVAGVASLECRVPRMTLVTAAGLLALLGAYLLGSFPTAIVLSRARGSDLRDRDLAGASGATRQFGLRAGVVVALLDLIRGLVAALLVRAVAPEAAWLAPAAVVAGHNWPVFYGFRGGQGVMPTLGSVIALWPIVGMIGTAAFGLAVLLHVRSPIGRAARLPAVPTGMLAALPASMLAAPAGSGALAGLLALTLVLGARGLQVLLSTGAGTARRSGSA